MSKELNPKMDVFMQALYGVVMGVSLANLKIDWNTIIAEGSHKVPNPIYQRFTFFMLLFTLAIAAHDWFVYHRKTEKPSDKFRHYIPEMFALFFLGLMFTFCNYDHIKEWYWAGLGYTAANIASYFLKFKTMEPDFSRLNGLRYIAHSIIICYVLSQGPNEFKVESVWYSQALGITAFVVIGLWCIRYERGKKWRDKNEQKAPQVREDSSKTKTITFSSYSDIIAQVAIKYKPLTDSLNNLEYLKAAELSKEGKTDEEIIEWFSKNEIISETDKARKVALTKYLSEIAAKESQAKTAFLNSQTTELKEKILK